MCGITGYLSAQPIDTGVLQRMAKTLTHRGPDDEGIWQQIDNGIGLAHRRLAIVDLSLAGHQPMHANGGRYTLVFNGEIYNHAKLRHELMQTGYITQWRGHSDTETLLAGIETWGLEATLNRSIGMFALALWDKQTQTLTLARDRIGEKPLYYGWQGNTFLFGSELKALRANPTFQAEIDRGALCLFLRQGYIPTPYSIYQGIAKLEPGSLLRVSLTQRTPEITTFWSASAAIATAVANPFIGDEKQAIVALEDLLKDAVYQQMMTADVPLGAFLSGGLDSSTVVALMQAQSSKPIKTFSIGFTEEGYDEAVYAKAVAQHLGTEHTELYVTPDQARAVIPLLPSLYDEPFADASQIPTYLVSQLAKQHVTVSLSGDAGDELFCGYSRYQLTARLWRNLSILPMPIRQLAAHCLTRPSPDAWNQLAKRLRIKFAGKHLGHKLHRGAEVLLSHSVIELYQDLLSHWREPHAIVIDGFEAPTGLTTAIPNVSGLTHIERMMALDTVTYLPDDILVKVDRAAMAVSLESRIPFLDHRVLEFAWRLPQSMKFRNGQSKWILRQVLFQYVPKQLLERPKMGFGVPIGKWLQGPLRDWAEALLDESRLRQAGYFEPTLIRQRWNEHLSGNRNWEYSLWDILMFQAWLEDQ